MRRNFNGGPAGGQGQNWKMQQRRTNPIINGGPLMTDHLGLQDIDKELELLKRKREIIEQQQQILSHEFRRNEPQFNTGSRFDNYENMYDDNIRGYDQSRKRPISVWESDVPSKRFSGSPRPRGPRPLRSGPVTSNYQGSQPRQPFRQPAKPAQKPRSPLKKDAKITKGNPPINKLDTYPVAERKKLVSEANGLADSSKLMKLRSDREPSKQMTGRLELALGGIIKDIRTNPELAESVTSVAVMRQIKKTVRDRIREVMIDQVVGPSNAIKARYREIYDEQSDKEVVAKALASLVEPNQKIVQAEDYFKNNMNKIVEARLKELLSKLEEISRTTEYGLTIVEQPANGDPKTDDKPELKELDESITSSDRFKAMDKYMTYKIINNIRRHIPSIIKIMDLNKEYTALKASISSDTVKLLEGQDVSISDADASLLSNASNKRTPRTPFKPLPYYAKLMGKPGLPKRNVMQGFFEEYKPKSIKKHRTVHNLLFVGFEDKESYDKLLAADGTQIGKFTLSIRVSERSANPEADTSKAELDTPKAELETANPELNTSISSDDKVIGSDLDEQITDLLTSISKDSEATKEDVETDVDVKKEEGADDVKEDGKGDIQDESAVDDNADNDDLQSELAENTPQSDEATTGECEDAKGIQTDMDTVTIEDTENVDAVPEIAEAKQPLKGTPARTSARIAGTPGRIQTRRSSKLPTNDA